MEALNPAPFHELIVRIKTARDETDADLVAALEFLKERFPQESQWSEHLGHVYFRERDTKRALSVLDEALRSNLKGMRVRSLVLAAESARLQGDPARAVSILETAYRLHPGDTNLLNNLVYTLAETPAGLPRARELLPELLKLDSRNFAVLDTAAAVYLKSGDLEKAKTYMERALAGMDEKNYAALDVKLNSAELLMRLGKLADARERASAVRRDPRRTDIVDVRARDILSRIEREMGGQKNKAP
jgi:Tfp pilus assembly protein PilF